MTQLKCLQGQNEGKKCEKKHRFFGTFEQEYVQDGWFNHIQYTTGHFGQGMKRSTFTPNLMAELYRIQGQVWKPDFAKFSIECSSETEVAVSILLIN